MELPGLRPPHSSPLAPWVGLTSLRTSWNTISQSLLRHPHEKCSVWLHYAPSSVLRSSWLSRLPYSEDSRGLKIILCSPLYLQHWHTTWHTVGTHVKFKCIHFNLIYHRINKMSHALQLKCTVHLYHHLAGKPLYWNIFTSNFYQSNSSTSPTFQKLSLIPFLWAQQIL